MRTIGRRLAGTVATFAVAAGCGSSGDAENGRSEGEDLAASAAAGAPVALPGILQAENYCAGGSGTCYADSTASNLGGVYRSDAVDIEATADTGGGYDVGWITAGEWLAFDVTVATPGAYTFTARVASATAGARSLHVAVDGAAQPSKTFTGGAGWQVWSDLVLGEVELSAGSHVVKIQFDTDKMNLNYVNVALTKPDCTLSATLVPSCGALLGAATDGDGLGGGFGAEVANHEQRIGRKLDMPHFYAGTSLPLVAGTQNANDLLALAARGSHPYIDWKVASGTWASIGSGNHDAVIDQAAANFKAAGAHKFFLSFYHEPEDNVNDTAGSGMTTADYVSAYRRIRARFVAAGVTNVVWVMCYMGYVPHWAGIFKGLWPGNDAVDWVMWDPYGDTTLFGASNFYDWMEANTDAAHAFTSKPWGIAEWGTHSTASQANAYALYDGLKTDLDQQTHPRVKAYVVFDVVNGGNFRTNQTSTGATDPVEQQHYNLFANDPLLAKH